MIVRHNQVLRHRKASAQAGITEVLRNQPRRTIGATIFFQKHHCRLLGDIEGWTGHFALGETRLGERIPVIYHFIIGRR